MSQIMPAIFVGHGSPMTALGGPHADSWRALGNRLTKPRAILVVSAHWCTRGTSITAMDRPRTIHDFAGFPRALSDIQYGASGDPELARQVGVLLQPVAVTQDQSWGLDHGCWQVLMHMFPQADVPVVQLSLDAECPAAAHYALGKRLAPLRAEGVLLIGSGNIVHNLHLLDMNLAQAGHDWAVRYNDAVRSAILRKDHDWLIRYDTHGNDGARAVPTPEHYLPLLYMLGAQARDDDVSFFNDDYMLGAISMTSVLLG